MERTTAGPGPAERYWREALGAWAIPDAILAAAPEPPWGFPAALFSHPVRAAGGETTPSRRRALEALREGGTVLDVGAGGGAASLALVPPAGRIVGVDESSDLLESLAASAVALGVDHEEILGRWPDVAVDVPTADVVVCHHVAYNVADLGAFLVALAQHATRRVVVELTARHPQSDLSPLWLSIHGLERPAGPTADDAVAVAREVGIPVQVDRFAHPTLWHGAPRAERVAFARRRLCVGAERDEEIAAYLDSREVTGCDRELVAMWWDRATP